MSVNCAVAVVCVMNHCCVTVLQYLINCTKYIAQLKHLRKKPQSKHRITQKPTITTTTATATLAQPQTKANKCRHYPLCGRSIPTREYTYAHTQYNISLIETVLCCQPVNAPSSHTYTQNFRTEFDTISDQITQYTDDTVCLCVCISPNRSMAVNKMNFLSKIHKLFELH